jgi:hypothetical protein
VLVLAGALGIGCPLFMFWQLCVADGEGVAVLVDTAFAAVVPVLDEVVADEVVDEWLVAALAAAMLPPNPTPSAPAPTAVVIMILPSLDLKCPPPRGR